MLYDPSTSSALQAWLVKTLEPICDAEPEALATYILALLKHDVPEHELRKEVVMQLNEFFEDGANDFVDTLFAALRSKSYIPYTTTPSSYPASKDNSQDGGIPIPLDALISPSSTSPDRGTKRNRDGDERDLRGPPKGPRLGNSVSFARSSHTNGKGNGQTDRQRADGMVPNGAPKGPRVMLPKGVCRDYHLKGFCSRGAMCKYTHDEGAFTPQIPLGLDNPGIPFMGMYGGMPFPANGPMQPTAYDPNDSRLDMHPHGQFQHVPTMPRGQNGTGHGELPATPARPQSSSPMDATSSLNQSYPVSGPSGSTTGDVQMNSPSGQSPDHNALGSDRSAQPQPNGRPQRGNNAKFRGRMRGGRGTFSGDHQSFSGSEQGRNSKTIVVEKIPDEKLSLETVNGWFKRFGTVTNVAVDAPGKKALVSFSSHEEARAAWSAEEAVFNNRFVKIFWHRPMEGQGLAGARALQASAPIVANIAAQGDLGESTGPEPPKLTTPFTAATTAKTPMSVKLTALQEKQQLLEKQIAEQKELMGKLSSATGDEKKEIMTRLRKLASEMKTSTTEKSAEAPHSRAASAGPEDKEQKKKELLDMELDVHAKTSEEGSPAEVEETRESLQEKLAKLRAEASALGITDVSSPPYQPPHRGFRGRGRGRATFRGAMRGGPPRSSMKLDNRPKALLVKGIASQDPEVVQAVRSWYEAGGQLASLDVHDEESLVARFNSRATAEQALAKGPNIPSAGAVKLSWHNDTAALKTVPAAPLDPSVKQPAVTNEDRPSSPRPEDTPEEIGWGIPEDDGMGMGGIF